VVRGGLSSCVFLRLLFAACILAPAAAYAATDLGIANYAFTDAAKPVHTYNVPQKAATVPQGTNNLSTTATDGIGSRFAMIINCKITQFYSLFNSH